jgi:hypothetical protein
MTEDFLLVCLLFCVDTIFLCTAFLGIVRRRTVITNGKERSTTVEETCRTHYLRERDREIEKREKNKELKMCNVV